MDGIMTKAFKILGIGHSFKIISSILKIKTRIFKQLKEYICKSNNPFSGMEDSESSIGYVFQFQIWKKALDVKYQFEILVILISSFIMLWFANYFIDAGVNVQIQYSIIQNLQNQPQTIDVIANLNSSYALMRIYNDNYLYYYYGLFYLSNLTFAFLLKDIQELIYSKIRSIFIQFFSIENLLDLFNAMVTAYWAYKHYFSYNIDLNHARYELQAWTLQNSMNNDQYFDVNYVLANLMGLQFLRLIM